MYATFPFDSFTNNHISHSIWIVAEQEQQNANTFLFNIVFHERIDGDNDNNDNDDQCTSIPMK